MEIGDINIHGAALKFQQLQANNVDASLPLLAALALVQHLRETKISTNAEFERASEEACANIKSLQPNRVSMIAGVHLFKSILKTPLDAKDFNSWKEKILFLIESRIREFVYAREECAYKNVHFLRDDRTVLIHSYSRSVMELLKSAVNANKRIRAFVTEARPSIGTGMKCINELNQLGIPCELIPDTAVGYIMERVDVVLVGAEAIVQSGGLINQIGTYQIAVMAKAAKRPFYAMAEHYKFIPLYPLNQRGLPTPGIDFFDNTVNNENIDTSTTKSDNDKINATNTTNNTIKEINSIEPKSPSIDYTPPEFITLILSDLGPLTPNGVSEQLALHSR